MQLDLGTRDGGVTLRVHVKPRASRSRVVAIKAGAVEVAVRAPPVDGAANAALIEVLAEALAVRRGSITVVSGQHSRAKIVFVDGASTEHVTARLSLCEVQ